MPLSRRSVRLAHRHVRARHLRAGDESVGADAAFAVRDHRIGCVSATGPRARERRGRRVARQPRAHPRAGRAAAGDGARLDRLGLRQLGDVHRCRRARRQQADRGLPADPRREADNLFGRDDGPARRGEGVRLGEAGDSEDAGPARHHVDVPRESRRSRCRRGGAYLAALGDADTPTPTQPLAPADRDALVGKYVYGPGPRDHFTIDVQQDRLGIDRPNSPARRLLMHTGNLVFFPTGVPTAKIAFARDAGRVTQLTLADPDVMLTAKKS